MPNLAYKLKQMKLLSYIIALSIPDTNPVQIAAALTSITVYLLAAHSILKEHYRGLL